MQALKLKTIFVSFETLRKPQAADEFMICSGKSQSEIQRFVSEKTESNSSTSYRYLKQY